MNGVQSVKSQARPLDMHTLVVRRLEDAGRTLAMLPMPVNGMPAEPRSAWPDVVQSFWDVVGHAEAGTVEDRLHLLALARNQPRFHADRAAISRLDEVLGWLWLIEEPHKRRTVAARMLVHPVSLRHIYKWSRLAKDLDASRSQIKRWFDDGIQSIIEGLADGTA